MSQINVTSHVGRDLLQSAQVFKTDMTVVWEYVANSLQYSDPGVPPRVLVSIDERNKQISVTDNGRGMDLGDLEHFFTMHAENRDRRAGRIGRGLFGTGKSAAFGIASSLTVISTKGGKKSVVGLEREAVEKSEDGSDIPVKIIQAERPCGEPNGTTVKISRIHLRRIDRESIIKFIEQRLAHYPRDVEVFVDAHGCAFREPEIAEQREFEPSGHESEVLGESRLIVKVAKSPLDAGTHGVQVFSHGNWLSTTLAGSEGRDMSEYLFGEVEAPALEDYSGPIKPFDNTRSGQLNPNNEIVAALYKFIGPSIERVRRELVRRQRERAKTHEAQQLSAQADRIAEVLNEDFADFQALLKRARAAVAGRGAGSKSYAPIAGDDDDGPWVEGGDELATPVSTGSKEHNNRQGRQGPPPPVIPRPVEPDEEGSTTGRPGGGEGTKRAPRGGIRVDFRNLGEDEHRAKYISDGREILINLDHPQISTEFRRAERNVQDPAFVRLSWDVAISEYAIALARLRDEAGHYLAVEEPLWDIRDTVNRLLRRVWSEGSVK